MNIGKCLNKLIKDDVGCFFRDSFEGEFFKKLVNGDRFSVFHDKAYMVIGFYDRVEFDYIGVP
jgi:hypothetical protein